MCRRAETMNARTTEVQAAVQQLVMERGEYAPPKLLPATNRLAWDDYRAWREGRLETLDAVLAGGTRETRAWLERARAWADALGLASEPVVHHGLGLGRVQRQRRQGSRQEARGLPDFNVLAEGANRTNRAGCRVGLFERGHAVFVASSRRGPLEPPLARRSR